MFYTKSQHEMKIPQFLLLNLWTIYPCINLVEFYWTFFDVVIFIKNVITWSSETILFFFWWHIQHFSMLAFICLHFWVQHTKIQSTTNRQKQAPPNIFPSTQMYIPIWKKRTLAVSISLWLIFIAVLFKFRTWVYSFIHVKCFECRENRCINVLLLLKYKKIQSVENIRYRIYCFGEQHNTIIHVRRPFRVDIYLI